MNKRLHVASLPWTQTTRKYLHCAYTQKVLKFCDMMTDYGYEVFLYSGDENEARCTEHIAITSESERAARYGTWSENNLFENITWGPPNEAPWDEWNRRLTKAIAQRAEPHDFFCPVTGWAMSATAEAIPQLLTCEWAVGYSGIHFPFRVFESYAWMHWVYGNKGRDDGQVFDAVIPNFFDPQDFRPRLGGWTDDYLLFVGRLVMRKGPHVAAKIAERLGKKLLVAGPGATSWEAGRIVAPEIIIEGEGVEYVGPVGVEERSRLMRGASAVIVPTLYVEPFGGVSIEAAMCGTPVVASDWGAFTETITPDIGRRFRTLGDGAQAVEEAVQLDRAGVLKAAHERFSLEAVAPMFDEHFQRLDKLWRSGWPE